MSAEGTERKRLVETPNESEERFQTIFAQAAVGIAQIGLDGEWLLVNNRFCQMLGYSETELRTKTLQDISQPDDFVQALAGRHQLLAGEISSHTMEKRYIRKDGTVFWGRLNRSLVRDKANLPKYFISVIEDITEKKQAESALRDSEQRFRATFFQAAVGIAQTSVQGEWLLLNDRFCEILGYTQAELRGKTFLDVTHPDDREANVVALRQFLVGEISEWSVEKRYVHKNGATVWAKVSVSLVRDQDHMPQYFVSVIEDITNRIHAERALQDSEQRLRLAQNAAHLAAWERDLHTNVIVSSGEYAGLYGLASDHPPLTYEGWLELIHPEDRERVRQLMRETLERTHVWDAEFRVVWPDASVHWLLGKGTVFLDESGRPVRIAGINVDITERKQSEEVRSHLAAIVESSDDAIVGKTIHGEVVSWNPGAERIYGYKAEEMLGRPISLLCPPECPDEVPQILERLRHGERLEHFETTRVRKDGCRIEVSVTISPINDRTGAVVGASVITREITGQKRAEAALRESEERLRFAQQAAGIGTFDWNIENGENTWTPELEAMYGLPPGGFPRTQAAWEDLVHPDDRARAVQLVTKSFESGAPKDLLVEVRVGALFLRKHDIAVDSEN